MARDPARIAERNTQIREDVDKLKAGYPVKLRGVNCEIKLSTDQAVEVVAKGYFLSKKQVENIYYHQI